MAVFQNSLARPQVLAQYLQARLQLRLPAYTFTTGTDANGYPVLLAQKSASYLIGQDNALVSITPVTLSFTNLIGQTADFQQTPCYANVCLENSSTTGISVASGSFNQILNTEVARLGTLQSLYLVNNGTTLAIANVATQITSSLLVSTILPDVTNGQLFGS